MEVLTSFLVRHWLSLTLLAGAAFAMWFVYHNRKKLFHNDPM